WRRARVHGVAGLLRALDLDRRAAGRVPRPVRAVRSLQGAPLPRGPRLRRSRVALPQGRAGGRARRAGSRAGWARDGSARGVAAPRAARRRLARSALATARLTRASRSTSAGETGARHETVRFDETGLD